MLRARQALLETRCGGLQRAARPALGEGCAGRVHLPVGPLSAVNIHLIRPLEHIGNSCRSSILFALSWHVFPYYTRMKARFARLLVVALGGAVLGLAPAGWAQDAVRAPTATPPLRLREAIAESLAASPRLRPASEQLETAAIQQALAASRFGLKATRCRRPPTPTSTARRPTTCAIQGTAYQPESDGRTRTRPGSTVTIAPAERSCS